jgi:hypothetical protein
MPTQTKISQLKPQRRNANRHTQRGMKSLEESIQRDGWIGALTVAANGETFDGSARLETSVATGFEDAIVVETDGTRPIVHVRTDIPTADDERAVRLGIAANRVAQTNLDWDPQVLAELTGSNALDGLFYDEEIDRILANLPGDDDWSNAMGGLPNGDKSPFQQMTFTLSNDQAEQVQRAIDKARKSGPYVDTGNENSNGNALARVCEAYVGQG